MENERVARDDLAAEFHIVNLEKIGGIVLGIFHTAEHEDAAHLSHGLDLQHTGHDGLMGEVPLEERLVDRHILNAHHVFLALLDDFVNEQHGIAMWQHGTYLVDVVQRLFVRVIDGGLNILVAQLLTDFL